MKKTRILSWLLALCLLLALFAGCAKTETTAESETAPAEAAAETTEPVQEAAPAEAEPAAEAPAAEDLAVEAEEAATVTDRPAEDGTYTAASGMTYPLDGEDLEVTLWGGGPQDDDQVTSYNEAFIVPYLKEYTGVTLVFDEVPRSATSEQFQLMIAAGDYDDLFDCTSTYNGGLAQAYTDEVIMDLTDLLETDAPDFWACCQDLTDVSYEQLQTTTDDGSQLILAVRTISDASYTKQGPVVRTDWLEECGYTVDDLALLDTYTQALYDIYAKYGCDSTILVSSNGVIGTMGVTFDTSLQDISSSSGSGVYLDNGIVVSALVSDGYRDYLEWFHQLYADGIINADFYSYEYSSFTETNTQAASDHCFQWGISNDSVADVFGLVDDGSTMEIAALPTVMQTEDQINAWGTDSSLVNGMGAMSISTDCDDPTLVLNFLNYHYTDWGRVVANYGVEGETFTLDEEGKPAYTDLILNNANFSNVQAACKYYTIGAHLPMYNYETKLYAAYGKLANDCVTIWSEPADSTDHSFPSTLALTTTEQSSITDDQTDVGVYCQEMILKFMTGAEELNDSSWAEYVDGCYQYGLQNIIDVYQNAYDEFQAGTRVVEAGAMPAPGGDMPEPSPEG